jgi:hypothetical protein
LIGGNTYQFLALLLGFYGALLVAKNTKLRITKPRRWILPPIKRNTFAIKFPKKPNLNMANTVNKINKSPRMERGITWRKKSVQRKKEKRKSKNNYKNSA